MGIYFKDTIIDISEIEKYREELRNELSNNIDIALTYIDYYKKIDLKTLVGDKKIGSGRYENDLEITVID